MRHIKFIIAVLIFISLVSCQCFSLVRESNAAETAANLVWGTIGTDYIQAGDTTDNTFEANLGNALNPFPACTNTDPCKIVVYNADCALKSCTNREYIYIKAVSGSSNPYTLTIKSRNADTPNCTSCSFVAGARFELLPSAGTFSNLQPLNAYLTGISNISSISAYCILKRNAANDAWECSTTITIASVTDGVLFKKDGDTYGIIFNTDAADTVNKTIYFPNAAGSVTIGPAAGFITFTGPSASRSFVLPDASATICTTNGVCTGYQASGSYGLSTGQVWTGVHDFGGAVLEIPNGTSGTTDATGEAYLDTNGDGGTNFSGPFIQVYTGAANAYLFPVALPLAASQDDYILKYDALTKTVGWEVDASGGGGYTNLTEFLTQTAWRIFYSDGSGDVKELAFGDSTKVLTSNGASAAPTWETAGSGSGTVSSDDYLELAMYTTNPTGTTVGGGKVKTDANGYTLTTVKTTSPDYILLRQDNDAAETHGWIWSGHPTEPSANNFTAYLPDADSTEPTAGQVLAFGAPSSNTSQMYYAGPFRLKTNYTKCSVIKGATTEDDFPLEKFPIAITITAINCYAIGGTNVVGGLDECTGTSGVCSSVTAVDSDITCTAGNNVADDGSLTNGGITANNWVQWHTTSVSGNTSISICFTYTVD